MSFPPADIKGQKRIFVRKQTPPYPLVNGDQTIFVFDWTEVIVQ